MIHGHAAPQFAAVAEAFEANVRRRREVGAALSVCLEGETVVDLWAGTRDLASGAPWERDTLVVMFSATKGVAAICAAMAVARGILGFDEPIAAHWPEFAQNGKAKITLRQFLSHSAGLAYLDTPIDLILLANPNRLADALARQAPHWPPGAACGYHMGTLGLYLSEILRRADPMRRSLGRFFAEEIAEPCGIDFHIGLPDGFPDARIAPIVRPRLADIAREAPLLPRGLWAQLLNPFSRFHRAVRTMAGFDPNDREWLKVEMPSVNGIGEARGLARLYGLMAVGGGKLGVDRATFEVLCAAQPAPRRDTVFGLDLCWGLGFFKPSPRFAFSPSPHAFGMAGVGGCFAFADPDARLGYAYAPNRLSVLPFNDPRETALRQAVYACLRPPQ